MDNNQSYRIHTEVGKDKKLDVHLQQNVGLLQILSLSLKQSDAYTNKSSNYGIIVGRVLANDAFGIENVKVSVFIPVTDDYFVARIRSLYPFRDINRRNGINNKRYNLLEDTVADECHADVGSFPNKRLVLDDNTYIEIFEKYYKYTTVTNKAGDYMLYGVPTGNQQVHMDLDLSNIGILSQKPRDFFYKGYGTELFKNAEQFKESTNLDNLVQIITQNKSINVYPFWGDEQNDTVAITRCDIKVDYEFESTCVFMGSVVTDGGDNAVGNRCLPARYVGKNSKLITGEGTIEMIRKTQDGYTEEYNIKGGRLIDGDGVWCYQIPMNLDYIQTDEEGHLIPSQDPKKGIATRARVRFRMTMDDDSSDGKSKHRAKYLVPNNPIVEEDLVDKYERKYITGMKYHGPDLNNQYIYGSDTQDSDFRDLQWNKVYTVKSFIPRMLNGASKRHFLAKYRENSRAFLGIKSSNTSNDNNPFPYNSFMGTISFKYKIICNILTILMDLIYEINGALRVLKTIASIICYSTGILAGVGRKIKKKGNCVTMTFGDYIMIPNCESYEYQNTIESKQVKEKNLKVITTTTQAKQLMQEKLAEEFDVVDLDFSDDWVNGVLYFPMWHWLKKKKKKFFWGLFSKKAVDRFCNCDKGYSNRIQYQYVYNYKTANKVDSSNMMSSMPISAGIVKQFYNRDNVDIYYYAPAVIGYRYGVDNNQQGTLTDTSDEDTTMVRMFATDIVLIGSLMNDDLDGVSKLFRTLPQTTANVPNIGYEVEEDTDYTNVDPNAGDNIPYGTTITTGMDEKEERSGDGLFFGLTCNSFYPMGQGPVNAQRICELGVNADETHYYPITVNNKISYGLSVADALITKVEMYDINSRAEFATYNSNPLLVGKLNKLTGYKTYNYDYKYPTNFDGTIAGLGEASVRISNEGKNESYLDFRFGKNRHYYLNPDDTDGHGYAGPIFNNSFYFYFGLKEGKTAIDKFRSTYYVDCVKNSKLDFPVVIDIRRKGKSCRADSDINDFPKIDISLISASKPYELYIKDEDGDEVFRIQDCNLDGINLERYFWCSEAYGTVKVPSSEKLKEEIMPQVYTVYVKDGLNKTSFATMDMRLDAVAVNTKASAFTVKSDTLDNKIDYEKSGYITIDSISVDGESARDISESDIELVSDVTLDNIDELPDIKNDDGDYVYEKYHWIIKIGDEYFLIYSVDNQSNAKYKWDYELEYHEGRWYASKPCTINLMISKLCPLHTGEKKFVCLTDFAGNFGGDVEEYEPYIMTLNDVDIQGWVKDEDKMKDSDGISNLGTANDADRLKYWTPETYRWNTKPLSQQSYWEDVIEGYSVLNSQIEKATAVVAYKFNSLFNICSMLYVTNTSEKEVSIGYNGAPYRYYSMQYGQMVPNQCSELEQTSNSFQSYNYSNSPSFAIDGNAPVYCQQYGYIGSQTTEKSYTSYKISDTNDTDVVENAVDLQLNNTYMYFTGSTLTKNQNSILNPNNQKFGYYNCMISCYETDDDGNISYIEGLEAPHGAVYQEHTVTTAEVKSYIPNWLSMNDFDFRVSSRMVMYATSNAIELFGHLYGGLYLATDGDHNVIDVTDNDSDGSTSKTTYSFDKSLLGVSPDVHVNTSLNRRLYKSSLSLGDNSVYEFPYTVTGDVLTDGGVVEVNKSKAPVTYDSTSPTTMNYEIVNNSWEIDLASDVIVSETNPETNTISISGIVNSGNSFTQSFQNGFVSNYVADYGKIAEESNFLGNITKTNTRIPWISSRSVILYPNITTSKDGVVSMVLMRIHHDQIDTGSYMCFYNTDTAKFVSKISVKDNNTDFANNILANIPSDTKMNMAVTYDGSLNGVMVYDKSNCKYFVNNMFDTDNGANDYYFSVPSVKDKSGKESLIAEDTPFKMTVMHKLYNYNWRQTHTMNELYVVTEQEFSYHLPYESIKDYEVTVRDGYKYYYYDKTELGYKEITVTDGKFKRSDYIDQCLIVNSTCKIDAFIAYDTANEQYISVSFSD